MSVLWISYDFKDEKVFNALESRACPDFLENSQKQRSSFTIFH